MADSGSIEFSGAKLDEVNVWFKEFSGGISPMGLVDLFAKAEKAAGKPLDGQDLKNFVYSRAVTVAEKDPKVPTNPSALAEAIRTGEVSLEDLLSLPERRE